MTKKRLAEKLDKENPMFAFTKSGLTHYSNYTKDELLSIMVKHLDNKYSKR